MSLKYQRVRQRDEQLPCLLKYLTRAFSSITMAVTLLLLIACYGVIGSVPIGMLATAALMCLAVALPIGIALVGTYRLGRSRWLAALLLIVFAILITVMDLFAVFQFTQSIDWFSKYHATVIYRLRYFEMTELELYSWWPMKLLLGLFVLNMIWATLRRIELKFVNIGVLTVHSGIVILTLGSMIYGHAKYEGDTILWRDDQPLTEPVNTFYDAVTPAVYFAVGKAQMMIPLPQLPRYNDYDPQTHALAIKLHETPGFSDRFGKQLKATIPGFLSYANLQSAWLNDNLASANPAWQIQLLTGKNGKPLSQQALVANYPAKRYIEGHNWAVEYLLSPSPLRMAQLNTQFPGQHNLTVTIPSKGFKQTFPITPGNSKSLALGNSETSEGEAFGTSGGGIIDLSEYGYQLTVEQVGLYELPIVTEGYRGGSDSQATVRIDHGGQTKTRIVMSRFPELSQEFSISNTGKMGQRTKPSNDILITYHDRSISRFYLIQQDADKPQLQLLICLPNQKPLLVPLTEDRFPLAVFEDQSLWLQLLRHMPNARQTSIPVPVAHIKRVSKEEGTYLNALLPVDLELPLADGSIWSHRIWLAHMRYPNPGIANDQNRPIQVNIPTLGKVQLSFSRERHDLPFSIQLNDFAMEPYPGSTMPRDFYSDLTLTLPTGQTIQGTTRLNHPMIHNRIKISQTGWDPGDPQNSSNQEKNAQGRYKYQQRYVILGIGNNVGIQLVFLGACLITLGIPWAFYVKPALVQMHKRKIQKAINQTIAKAAQ